jgi:hypothetical protein
LALGAVFGLLLFPGVLLGAAFVGMDLWLRSTPGLVASAATEVERECYGISSAPELAVRAAPSGYNAEWTTFAVRRADESRPGVGTRELPSDWAVHDDVHPYEATISYNSNGALVDVTCRKIGPGTGNATQADLEQVAPDNNPLSPKTTGSEFLPRFFTQGVAGPTEEGRTKAREDAKAAADAQDDDQTADDTENAKDGTKDAEG